MIVPHLFHRNRIWHFRATVAGRRIQRTTRQKTKSAATKVAIEIIEQAERKAAGRALLPTVRQLARQWLETFENTHSASHFRNMEIFERLHLDGLADARIDAVDTLMVERARDAFLRSHSISTANAWAKNLKLLFRWAVRTGVIVSVPWTVVRLTPQKPVKTVLYAEQFAGWLAAIDDRGNEQLSTVVRLMLQLGLRESEVFAARWEWFDWHADTFTPGKTKGREADPLPLVPSLRVHLFERRRASGLIVSRKNGRPLSGGWFSKQFEIANQRAGTPGITPHSLRRSFATHLHHQGLAVNQIGKLLRHKSIAVTELYIVRRRLDAVDVMRRADEASGITPKTAIQPEGLVHVAKNLRQETGECLSAGDSFFQCGVGAEGCTMKVNVSGLTEQSTSNPRCDLSQPNSIAVTDSHVHPTQTNAARL